MLYHRRQLGFTIVELALVIAIIGILSTLVFVNYAGTQARSRDAQRLSDAKAIEAALESFRSEKATYPNDDTSTQVVGATTNGWETSGAAQPGIFLSAIEPYIANGIVPVDPKNDTLTHLGNTYRYATYSAGSYSCDVAKGKFYVFIVNNFETISTASPHSPGFSCSGRNWSNEGDYVVGHYVYD